MLGSRVGVLANAVGKQVKTSRFTNAVHWQLRCWCSYYSPESILTRLNRPRRASKSGKPSRSKPPKSEEEVWMEAGAPGYFDNSNDPLEAPRQTQNLPAAAEDQQSTQHEDVFAHGVAPSFDSSEGQTTTAHQPIVKYSTISLKPEDVSKFLAVFETVVDTIYADAPGFLSIEVLHDADTNKVRSVQHWRSAAHYEAATNSKEYAMAMKMLSKFMVDRPEVETYERIMFQRGRKE